MTLANVWTVTIAKFCQAYDFFTGIVIVIGADTTVRLVSVSVGASRAGLDRRGPVNVLY